MTPEQCRAFVMARVPDAFPRLLYVAEGLLVCWAILRRGVSWVPHAPVGVGQVLGEAWSDAADRLQQLEAHSEASTEGIPPAGGALP